MGGDPGRGALPCRSGAACPDGISLAVGGGSLPPGPALGGACPSPASARSGRGSAQLLVLWLGSGGSGYSSVTWSYASGALESKKCPRVQRCASPAGWVPGSSQGPCRAHMFITWFHRQDTEVQRVKGPAGPRARGEGLTPGPPWPQRLAARAPPRDTAFPPVLTEDTFQRLLVLPRPLASVWTLRFPTWELDSE